MGRKKKSLHDACNVEGFPDCCNEIPISWHCRLRSLANKRAICSICPDYINVHKVFMPSSGTLQPTPPSAQLLC